jgi:hypothetical protein
VRATFPATSVFLLVVALAACHIPAPRAIAVALGLMRPLTALLFGVSANDHITFVAASMGPAPHRSRRASHSRATRHRRRLYSLFGIRIKNEASFQVSTRYTTTLVYATVYVL